MKKNKIIFTLFVFCLQIILFSKVNAQALTSLKPILDAQIGQSVIEIPAGTYLLDNATSGFYHFDNLKDVEIKGNGAKIICNSQEQAFRFTNCKRVSVKDLSIDYDPLCFTQGKIIAIAPDNSSFDVEIDEGYPIENIRTSKINIYDSITRELKRNSIPTYAGNYTAINDLGDRKFRLAKKGTWSANEAIGDLVTLVVAANKTNIVPHTIQLDKCEDVLLEDITIYGSNNFSFYENQCSATHYNRCKVAKGEVPIGISSRLRSGNADGIHCSLPKIGPTIENCEVGYNGDDCIVIAGCSYPITKIDSINKTIDVLCVSANPAMYEGDTLQRVEYNGIQSGTMKILSMVKFTPGTEEANIIREKYPYLESPNSLTKGLRISVLELPENIAVGDIVYNANYMGKGFKIRNNCVKSTRSRGILVKGSSGYITDNKISNCVMNGILVGPEVAWMGSGGGGFSDSLIIKGNIITNCMFGRASSTATPGSLSIFCTNFLKEIPPIAGAFNNIVVNDNVIGKSPYPGIVFTSVNKLSYDNNQVIQDTTNTTMYGANYGVIFTEPIWGKNNTYNPPNNLSSGNIIVVRIGDGNSSLSALSAPVFFDEYKPDGTFVQSVPLRTSIDGVNKRLTLSGNKTDEGYIALSPDSEKIAIFGYDCDTGVANPSSIAVGTINRVVGVLTADKVINTSKYFNNIFNAVAARSAIANGNDIWVAGGAYGIVHTTYNATGAATTNTNLTSGTQTGRVLSIYNGQLYTSTLATGYRMATVGIGIPTTAGQSLANLPGYPTTGNPLGYVFVDLNPSIAGLDVLYAADASGGLRKYSFDGTNWISNGSISGNYRGLTARVTGNNVIIYGTRTTTTSDEFFSLIDNNGYDATFSSTNINVLAKAAENTVFRGITFAPGTNVLPVNFGQLKGNVIMGAVQLGWETYSEQNNCYFDVLRSQNGKTFEKIGEVNGLGISDIKRSYSFEDKAPIEGNNYYRLRQVDADGAYRETGIIMVKNVVSSASLEVYISAGLLKTSVYSSVAGGGKLFIYDLFGKRLYEGNLKLSGGNQQFVLEKHLRLGHGVFIAVFSNSLETLTHKFIL